MQPIGYSYIRFSSKKQAKGSSLHRQTQDTCAGESPASWCARHKVLFDTTTTFRDLGKSAFQGEKQKELYAFLEMIGAGTIRPGSFLLVEKVDRISRKGVDEGYELCKKILKAGVSIVSLSRGRVYGPEAVTGLMKGALELQIELEQAYQYSKALSERVAAAWELKRKKAREGGTLATKVMPPWLAPAGEGDARRAVAVPEKAAVMRRIIDMVMAGQGAPRIVRTFLEEGVPPLSRRQKWCRTTVRRLVTDRALIGEYQPMKGRGKDRRPDGPPVEGYYPAIVSAATFHQARACLGGRRVKNAGRDSKLVNVFAGLLKVAGSDVSYITALRVERGGRRHHVLLSANKTGASSSFPFRVFERAVLGRLREIDARELLPPTGEADEVLALSAELKALEADVAVLNDDLDRNGEDPTVLARVRAKNVRHKHVATLLAEARLRAACPLAEALGEAQTLLGTLDAADAAGEGDAARLRLKAVLRRVVKSMPVLVVRRGTTYAVAVQVWFENDRHRDYLVRYRPARSNGKATVPAWSPPPLSFAAANVPGDLDLRDPVHVRVLEKVLSVADLEKLQSDLNPPTGIV
jgi:DNA invertase Pin-like site-specific DNA recombinase